MEQGVQKEESEEEHGQLQGRGNTQCLHKIPSGVMGVWPESALVVQKEAAIAVADGADHKDLVMLAKLGSASHDDSVGPLMCVAQTCLCTIKVTWITYLTYMVPII